MTTTTQPTDFFFDPVMLEYNGNYAEFQVACDLSAFNICSAFRIDIGRGFSSKWLCVVNSRTRERIEFVGEGLRTYVPGSALVRGAMYEVVTEPRDITREESFNPPPLIVTIQHLKKAMRFDLSGKMGLVKFRIESELNVDRRYFEALGLVEEVSAEHAEHIEHAELAEQATTATRREIPFVKSENSQLDEIVCSELRHDAFYSVWAVDRREALLDLLEPEDLQEIQRTFQELDEDGSGSIDVNEIQRFIDREFQEEEQRLSLLYESSPGELIRRLNALAEEKLERVQQFFAKSQGAEQELGWIDFLFSEASKYVGRKRILVRFGHQEREVIIKPAGELITVEMHPMLTLEQQSALDMRCLRNVDSGALVEFVREAGSPYKSIQNDELENFGVYDIVVADLRASRIAALPAEVIDNVSREFAEFDPSAQGFVTLEQLDRHFASKLEADRHSADAQKLTADELDYFLHQRAEQYHAQLRQMRSLDINADDRVSLEEYLVRASNNVERYIDVNFKITCGAKEYPLKYRMNAEIKLSELKLLVGAHSPIHQQFWRYLHLMCRSDGQFTVVFLDRERDKSAAAAAKDGAYTLKVVKLRDGHVYEMVREDLRQTASKLLSAEQIEDARRRFDAIDHDRSGIIEVKDAEALFAKKSSDAIEQAYKQFIGEPDKLEVALRQARELANLSKGFMTSFAHAPEDESIEFDDFLAAHAFFLFKDRLATQPSGFESTTDADAAKVAAATAAAGAAIV